MISASIEDYFSPDPPNCSTEEMAKTANPSRSTVLKVAQEYEKRKGEMKSICVPYTKHGNGKRMEVYILSVWVEMLMVRDAKEAYKEGLQCVVNRAKSIKRRVGS
jgi:hypothetical protein